MKFYGDEDALEKMADLSFGEVPIYTIESIKETIALATYILLTESPEWAISGGYIIKIGFLTM